MAEREREGGGEWVKGDRRGGKWSERKGNRGKENERVKNRRKRKKEQVQRVTRKVEGKYGNGRVGKIRKFLKGLGNRTEGKEMVQRK